MLCIISLTNYYFIIESQLQISVLNLFCELQFRFSNMVTATITRDSVRNALKKGITAQQVRIRVWVSEGECVNMNANVSEMSFIFVFTDNFVFNFACSPSNEKTTVSTSINC